MTGDFDEELHDALNALSADVSVARLPGAGAARRRAAQRTRRQVAGGVVAGVAAMALGVFGITQEQLFSAPEPAVPTETDTPTAEPSPPVSPDDTDGPSPTPDGATIPDGAFLTVDDITPDLEPGDFFPAWVEGDVTETPFDCAPAVPEGAAYRSYSNEQDGHFLQFIEETSDPVGRFSELRADIESCVQELNADWESAFSQVWAVDGLGDEAWMATYFDELDEPIDYVETNVVFVRMMRMGDHVSVVVDGAPGQDDNLNMDPERLRLSAQRLCEALGSECIGEVSPRRLDREPVGDIEGWLTVDDVTSVPGYEGVIEGAEPLDPGAQGSSGWPLANLVIDPVASGATSHLTRAYVPDDPGLTPLLHQSVATFPDDAAARAHYDELVTAADGFEQEGDEVTNTGSTDNADHSLTTWRSENAEYGTVFVYGVVVQGNAVSVVSTGFDEYEDRDLTPEQLTDLLVRAAEHLSSR